MHKIALLNLIVLGVRPDEVPQHVKHKPESHLKDLSEAKLNGIEAQREKAHRCDEEPNQGGKFRPDRLGRVKVWISV